MENLKIIRSQDPITDRDVSNFEKDNLVTLPNGYKKFLLQYNGGKPLWPKFPLPENPIDNYALIDWFFCILPGNMYDLKKWMNLMSGRLSKGFLPIAIDPGGNLICIKIDGDDYGNLYFWSHEFEASTNSSLLIATSFEEFLNVLEENI